MFEDEKTLVFWIGLIILGLASVGLFGILWMIAVWNRYVDRFRMLKTVVPVIVGGVVFILIGLYMMKSGVKKRVEMQSRSKEKSEKETKPENDLDDPTFVSKMGALLDFFSDRAVAHASFLVASVFGIVTLVAIVQQLNENDILFVWLSIPLFYAFSYVGCFTLVRFNYYANISRALSYEGLKRRNAFQKILFGEKNEERTLQDYMDKLSESQRRWLFSKKIFDKYPEWHMKALGALYWLAILFLGSIAYSKFWKHFALAWLVWGGLLAFLLLLTFFMIPWFLDWLFERKG